MRDMRAERTVESYITAPEIRLIATVLENLE